MIIDKIKKIADPNYRFFWLITKGFYHSLDDEKYLKKFYKAAMGKELCLDNPKTFNEKMQWLKLYDRNPQYITYVDKYLVKEYVASKIGGEHIIPTLGVWNKATDIDFDMLPDEFVLKWNHDSGSVIVCKDKSSLDKKKVVEQLSLKKQNGYWYGREWPYKDVNPKIIAEMYMEENDGGELKDYKFYCFDGEPKFLYLSQGLANHETARISYIDMKWERAPFYRNDFKQFEILPEKPKCFEQMISFAKKLSEGIPFIRIDLYEINGIVYFGEMTLYPGSGITGFYPEEWDYKIGDYIKLPIR